MPHLERRQFLVGAGALLVGGCSTGRSREWSDVPWVAPPVAAPANAYAARAPRAAALPVPPPAPPAPTPARAAPVEASVPRSPAPVAAPWRLVTRAEWGAAPLRANHDPMGTISRVTLHHTDEHDGMRGRSDVEVVRAIQTYHQDARGWADIGYHYLVGRDGRVYEGRAASAQGAHSGGANNRGNLGVSVIGNFSCALPPPAQLAALRSLLADRLAAHGLAPGALLGHRDLGNTSCPGDALYAWMSALRQSSA